MVEILNVEGGEIYYLLAGTFELMDVVSPLQSYIELNNASISEEDKKYLEKLVDPLNILKIMSVGYLVGQEQEVAGYSERLNEIISNPGQNISVLISIAKQLSEIFSTVKGGGNVSPISELSGGPSTTHITTKRDEVAATDAVVEKTEMEAIPQPISPESIA